MMCFNFTIIKNMQKSLEKGVGWIIDSVIDHTISISKYNPLAWSSYKKVYIKKKQLYQIPKKLHPPR